MLYRYLFRSRWAALFWAGWVCVGVYLRTPRPADSQDQAVTYVKPANPWAKTAN